MKTFIVVTLVLALLGAAGYGAYWQFYAKARAEAAKAPRIPTASAEEGPIQLIVSANGRMVSNLDVDIKCKASGEVVKLPFDISDTARKGELLAELDPVDEKREVDRSQASLGAAQAKLEQARHNLKIAEQTLVTDNLKAAANIQSAQARAQRARIKADRLKQTAEQNFTSKEDYEAAEAEAVLAAAELAIANVRPQELKTQALNLNLRREDIKLAEAQVASEQINLANAKQRLDDTRVVAPMDGVVSARTVQTGQIISSGVTNVGGGTTILTLSDLARIFVLGSVDESDIGKVALDQPVNITADAYPGMRFEGKVVRIAAKGVNVSNVVTFEVKIEVVSPNRRKLKPEMTANLEIIAAQKEKAVIVPAEAVSRKKGQRVVKVVLADGKTEERAVTAGINNGSQIEITAGLRAGEVVEVNKSAAESKWRSDPQRRVMTPFGPAGGRHP